MDLMSQEEALRYFGLPLTREGYDQLESIVVEHDVDIDLDEYGRIVGVYPTMAKEALFQEHLKKVGHRPDSPKEMAKEKDKRDKEEKEQKDKIEEDKAKLKMKVKMKEHGGA
jgi:uncharacterized protein YuzE